jgi:hypothetical protein
MCYRSFQKKGGTNFSSSIKGKNGILERINFLKKLENYCHNEMNIEVKHQDRMPYNVWWSILYMLRYPTLNNWEILINIYRMSPNKKKVYKYVIVQLPMLPILTAKHIKKKILKNVFSK